MIKIRYHKSASSNFNPSISWIKNNKYHRLNGPAVVWETGTKLWFQNGLRHRLDGPAREFSNGIKEWWINGEFIKDVFLQ